MSVDPRDAKNIFLKAIEKTSATERSAYLDQACEGDATVRARVEALLQAHEDSGSLLGKLVDLPGQTIDQSSNLGSDSSPSLGEGDPCEAVQPSPASPEAKRIGPYELVELLGEGGMGTVWVARQLEPIKRTVALKLMKRGTDSKALLARFEQERQALALMDHPNIARVIDAGLSVDGVPYFVMELVRGAPLTDFCDQHTLSSRERLELFVPICQAVQHAHQKGIIHRDLKPANILVTMYDGRPTPKVIDFGVAKATGEKLIDVALATQFGAIVGTLEYMSPEQAGASSYDVDTRADIYSLGVVLYELLTGLRPFDVERLKRAALEEMFRVIREEEPPRPSTRLSTHDSVPSLAALRKAEPKQLAAQLRGELDCVVMKCLEKDRDRRYATANGLARDIQRYLADDPVEARPQSSGYRLRKFARKNRMLLATAAAFVAVLLIGATISTWSAIRATRAENVALLARDLEAAERQIAEAARQRADSQTAIAQAISNFLQHDLLGQANLANQEAGDQGRDPNVKVVTLLDRASKRLDKKFRDQPLTEAALRLTLGRTYSALWQYDEALRHVQRAAELHSATVGSEHPDTLTSRFHAGRIYRLLGQFDRAELLEKDVLEAQRRVIGPDHDDTLTSQAELATLYYYQGKLDRAVPLLKGVLEHWSAKRDPDDSDLMALKHELARYYLSQRDYDRAEPLFKDLVKEWTAIQGLDHPDTFTIKHDLALLYLAEGRPELAEPLMTEVLHGVSRLYGPEHPRTLISKAFVAMVYRDQGKLDEAELMLRDIVRAQTAASGKANDAIYAMRQLAQLYQIRGKYEQAESLFQEILKVRAALLPPSSAELGGHQQRLAQLYQIQGKYDQAEPLLLQVLQANKLHLGENNLITLASTQHLARLYLAQGKYDAADPLLREVLEKRVAQLGSENVDTLSSKGDQARLFEARGDWTSAEPLWRAVLIAQRRRFSHGHQTLAAPLCDLGRNLVKQQKLGEAELLLREGMLAYDKGQLNDWRTSRCRSLLGRSLLGQKRFAEAESLLLQGHEGLVKPQAFVPAEHKYVTREALESIVELYESWGKKDQAVPWRKKLEAFEKGR